MNSYFYGGKYITDAVASIAVCVATTL